VANITNTVVVGTQWGDEGKGKVTDVLAENADGVVRYQGGNNAGHTLKSEDQLLELTLIPSGVLYRGKHLICGNGMVINPEIMCNEIAGLKKKGLDINPERLTISERTHLIMPFHPELDLASELSKGKDRIGTTRNGIGWAYRDKTERIGIRAGDLVRPETLKSKYRGLFDKSVSEMKDRFGHTSELDFEISFRHLLELGEQLKPYIKNTVEVLHDMHERGLSILFEGAQGTHLDLDQGTYPFVTSSNPTAGNASTGSGYGPRFIDKVVGVVKAYTSRVGGGPFPTEMGSDKDKLFKNESLDRANEMTEEELAGLLTEYVHSGDLSYLASYIRNRYKEFGVRTKRPRRIGDLDGVQVRTSAFINSINELAISCLDRLGGIPNLRIATAYVVNGEEKEITPYDLNEVDEVIYEDLEGFEDLSQGEWERIALKGLDHLPINAKRYIEAIEDTARVNAKYIGIGKDRKATIIRDI
jgi:adenylosuccinate synthase